MKKREMQAIIEAQAAEIAALRRRVEAVEAHVYERAVPDTESGGVTFVSLEEGQITWVPASITISCSPDAPNLATGPTASLSA